MSGGCTHSQAYWRNHPEAWPVSSLVLGDETYSQTELLELLGMRIQGDASRLLARALIAAKLNIAAGADAAPIAATVASADDLLDDFAGKLPYGIPLLSETGLNAILLALVLDLYNLGLLPGGPPFCDPPLSAPGASYDAVGVLVESQPQGRIDLAVRQDPSQKHGRLSLHIVYGLDLGAEPAARTPQPSCRMTVLRPDGSSIESLEVLPVERTLSEPLIEGTWSFVFSGAEPDRCLYRPFYVRTDLVGRPVDAPLHPIWAGLLLALGLARRLKVQPAGRDARVRSVWRSTCR